MRFFTSSANDISHGIGVLSAVELKRLDAMTGPSFSRLKTGCIWGGASGFAFSSLIS